MAVIDDLIPDIYTLLRERVDFLDPEGIADFGVSVAKHLQNSLETQAPREPRPGVLYPSDIGKPCIRQIWYKKNYPELGRKILPHTEIKFFMGDFGEELLLYLAKEAGHEVELEQEQVDYEVSGIQIRGRIDAVIDGVIVDVKTTSPYSFDAWNGKELDDRSDKFGYRWQVEAYRHSDQLMKFSHNPGRLFLLDKQNGKLGLASVPMVPYPDFTRRVTTIAQTLDKSDPPPRAFPAEDRKTAPGKYLNIACQYCDFNKECWKERNITQVARKGKVVWLVGDKPGKEPTLLPGDFILTEEYIDD